MISTWDKYLKILGCGEGAVCLQEFLSEVGETPIITIVPENYNDQTGTGKFYQFFDSGFEIGFRMGELNFIHFFIINNGAFNSYRGPLPNTIFANQSEKQIIEKMGPPSKTGGNKDNPLLGHVNKWIRYDFASLLIRYEFTREAKLNKVTLIKPS